MRNFWIEGSIDGRKTKMTGGPRGKNGGFALRIYMRDRGAGVEVLQISAFADRKLHLELIDPQTGQLLEWNQTETAR